MRRVPILLVFACGLGASGGPARAQDWINTVFPSREHDFGTVARGSKVAHSFKVVNTTKDEIHIVTYQAKCGCTEVKLGAQTIPPGTQTVIEAVIDTTKFQGHKASGLTLVIDRPQYVQVDLNLNCFIRGDLTLNPGQADFGTVNRTGKPAIDMVLTYAGGQADWAITKMQTLSPHVTARLTEQGRSAGGQVNYGLSVTLNPTAPVGFLKDEITLFTNDPSSPTIPVSVTANVQSNVTVTPAVMTLGQVRPGETIKKTVLVRSPQPFKVVGIKSNKPALTAAPTGDAAKALHSVTISFTAPDQPGPFHGVVELETDVKDEPPSKLSAFATVVPVQR
jgi:hypothetical protein